LWEFYFQGKHYMITRAYRQLRANAARTKIRNPLVWSWHLGLKPQDAFLASYPRSGSTWLRFILFETLCGENAGFRKIEDRLPEIHTHRGALPVLPGGGRLIKTHEQYRDDYKKAVFLIRDVRDVFLSAFAGCTANGLVPLVSKGDIDSFLESFLQGRALTMGSWHQHTRSWLDSPLARNGNLLVVRYEELRRNPEQRVAQILQFLGITPDAQAIGRAIENNSLQRMRAKEDSAKKAGEQSILLGRRNSPEEQMRFVRQGAVGGWREKLTDAQVRLIEQHAGETLVAAGYESALIGEAV
jgi:hypothetical protein